MWNDDDARPGGHSHRGDGGGGHAGEWGDVAWSAEQMARLEGEWRRLQRAYAYHPHVTLTPLRGDPPYEYQVDFRVTTLAVDEAGALVYAPSASVHLSLPPGFPEQPPHVRPLTSVFHPNVTWEGFAITSWHPAETLLGLVRKVGDLIAYRAYDVDAVVSPEAMAWVEANYSTLPTDAAADLSPAAGGEPLGRVCRYGEQTLGTMHQSLLQMQQVLFGFDAPDPAAVRDFTYKTRLALNLFLESDVPDHLRADASALDDCAREMPGDLHVYDFLRGRQAVNHALRVAVKALNDALLPLGMELDKLAGVVEGETTEPLIALKMIPESKVIQPFQLTLPKLVQDGERRVAAVKQQLAALDKARPPQVIHTDTLLGERLEKHATAVHADVRGGREEAAEALGQFEPVLARARVDAAALERVAHWREYIDMISRARAVERKVAGWGAAGVQAYFIENDSGRFGPFQFEQPVDMGGGDLVVRNPSRGAIEVRRAATESVAAQSDQGKVTIAIAAAAEAGGPPPPSGDKPPPTFATEFTLTERCDDLLVQLDFLRRQTAEMLRTFDKVSVGSNLWCGWFCRLLDLAESRRSLEKELHKVSYRWRQVMVDLAGLSPLKERIATYFLLQRASEAMPPLVATLRNRKAGLKASEKRLTEIVQRCGRDVETDNLIVPPKLKARYEQEMAFRKEASDTIKRSSALVKSLAVQLMDRLKTPKLLGKAAIPEMRTIAPLSEELATLPLADGQLGDLIVALEGLLGTPLGGPRPAPPEPEPVAETAEHEPAADALAETTAVGFAETAGEHEPAHADHAEAGEEPAGHDEAAAATWGDAAAPAEESPAADDHATAATADWTEPATEEGEHVPGEWTDGDYVNLDAPTGPPPHHAEGAKPAEPPHA